MKVGDLIRWHRTGLDEIVHMPWFKKLGIVVEIGEHVRPAVVTVMWDPGSFEEIFADDLEVLS